MIDRDARLAKKRRDAAAKLRTSELILDGFEHVTAAITGLTRAFLQS